MNITTQSVKKQKGQGMVEYIIIVALIAIAAIGVYSQFGKAIRGQMAGMTNELAGEDAKAGIDEAKKSADAAIQLGQTKTSLKDYNATASQGAKK